MLNPRLSVFLFFLCNKIQFKVTKKKPNPTQTNQPKNKHRPRPPKKKKQNTSATLKSFANCCRIILQLNFCFYIRLKSVPSRINIIIICYNPTGPKKVQTPSSGPASGPSFKVISPCGVYGIRLAISYEILYSKREGRDTFCK